MEPLLNSSSAFGLSGAAGLNAYIPLLLVSLLARLGIIHLSPPYDVMGQWWCVELFAVLCVIELVVDKVPGADHVNDIVQTFVRPTAGAILFASQAGAIHGVHPGVWVVVGLVLSGGVHAAKMVVRPAVNVTTAGIGAPVISLLEDLMSTVVSLLALLAPIFCLLAMVVFGWIGWKAYRRFRTRPVRVVAVPVVEETATTM